MNSQLLQTRLEAVQAEEFINKFRSKEDLYKYLVHQGKSDNIYNDTSIVGLFLPSISTTRISFLRAIMRDEKRALM